MQDQDSLLRAVIDRIVPPDRDGGGIDLGALPYLERHFSDYPADEALIRAGLVALGGADFTVLPAAGQDGILETVAEAPWFVLLMR